MVVRDSISYAPIVGTEVEQWVVDELNRQIRMVELNPGIDDEADTDIEVLKLAICILGSTKEDHSLHAEMICKGHESTIFIHTVPIPITSKARETTSKAIIVHVRFEIQQAISAFLSRLAQCVVESESDGSAYFDDSLIPSVIEQLHSDSFSPVVVRSTPRFFEWFIKLFNLS